MFSQNGDGKNPLWSVRESTLAQSSPRCGKKTPPRRPNIWHVTSLPRNILADTGPIFALLHAKDADHARALTFAREFTGQLITSWPVLAEAGYLLAQSNRHGGDLLLSMVLDGHLLVADLDHVDIEYMKRLMAKYDGMDLADASLVAVGERLGLLDIITIDRHDFSRYRTRGRKQFINHFPEK